MARPKLHLDADISLASLWKALNDKGHNVTRTPCEWMVRDADDRTQLLEATARGRCLATFNISDFSFLAQEYQEHGGIILAQQRQWRLATLIDAFDRLLSNTEASQWPGQVRWLNDWHE
jgi:hypothetical protein